MPFAGDLFGRSVAVDGDVAIVGALIASVEQLRDDGTLGRGIATALISKLENALGKIEQGNVRAATGMLGAFVNQVEALSGRRIPGDVADSLIAEATAIMEQLEMPAG